MSFVVVEESTMVLLLRGLDLPASVIENHRLGIYKDTHGCIVAVTRTDAGGRILEVIAEGKSFWEIQNERS